MRKLFGALIFLFLPVLSHAQCTGSSPTWSSTPDQGSVSACVSKASAGDTINVSAGTVTWSTSGIATSKAISIIGAGPGSTVINDAIPTNASTCSLFKFSPTVVDSLTRLSSMTLQPASGTSTVCSAFTVQGTCAPNGCPNIRLDHITFSGWAAVTKSGNSYGITAIGDVFGVIDHNTINGDQNGNAYLQLVELSHASYLGQGQWGDYSWNQPENYGSRNFIFIENNIFNHAGCCENEGNAGAYQTRGGGRVVARFNTFGIDHYSFAIGWHGTESNGRARGMRTWEFYGNTITCLGSVIGGVNYGCGVVIGARSGTGFSWGNNTEISQSKPLSSFLNIYTYRTSATIGGWPACDGSGPYDTNDGVTYYSGAVDSYNSSTHTITLSGSPGWASNKWIPSGAPYSLHDVTKGTGAEIASNGSNTLSINVGGGGPGDWSPTAGDSVQILRATACMDQAGGRGAGILYSGYNNTSPAPANPVAPANEVLSPSYLWANQFSPAGNLGGLVGTNTGRVTRNREYFRDNINQAAQSNPTTPFDGTTTIGMGYGALANRPTTCSAGVGYWAEDQGNWNTNSTTIPGTPGSTQGALYVCGTGGWPSAPSYVPYTYPHPLTNGGNGNAGDPVNPPTGLFATVQ